MLYSIIVLLRLRVTTTKIPIKVISSQNKLINEIMLFISNLLLQVYNGAAAAELQALSWQTGQPTGTGATATENKSY